MRKSFTWISLKFSVAVFRAVCAAIVETDVQTAYTKVSQERRDSLMEWHRSMTLGADAAGQFLKEVYR